MAEGIFTIGDVYVIVLNGERKIYSAIQECVLMPVGNITMEHHATNTCTCTA